MPVRKPDKPVGSEDQIQRVRRLCTMLPGVTEKLSHGEPTFFAHKRVFAMFSKNHHNDGHVAVLVPTAPGLQATLIKTWPEKYYYPAYVGCHGWVGIELECIGDYELATHLSEAWGLIAAKKRKSAAR